MNNNNNAIEVMQAENVTLREELLARIDNRSRLSSRASSRATSPRQLAARLQCFHEKMPDLEMPLEKPRVEYSETKVSMTEIFANKKAADDFGISASHCQPARQHHFSQRNVRSNQQAWQPGHEGDVHPYKSRKQGTPVQPSDIGEVLDFRA